MARTVCCPSRSTLSGHACLRKALAPFGQYGITLDEELRVLKIEGKDGKMGSSCHGAINQSLNVKACQAYHQVDGPPVEDQ